MGKIWVAVSVGIGSIGGVSGVVASTSLAEVSRGIGCSVWTLRRLRREHGGDGFTIEGPAGEDRSGITVLWYVVRVELRQVEGRGKAGKSGYRLKEKV